MDGFRRLGLDEYVWLAQMRYSLTRPLSHAIIKGVGDVDPRKALEELRRDDPDGHALLTEHIVIPERHD